MNDFDEGHRKGYEQACIDIKRQIGELLGSPYKKQSIYYNFSVVRSFAIGISDFIDNKTLVWRYEGEEDGY